LAKVRNFSLVSWLQKVVLPFSLKQKLSVVDELWRLPFMDI